MLRVRVPTPGQLGSNLVEQLMRQVIDALREIVLQVRRDVVIRGVVLPDATTVTVQHGLGYGYEHVSVSPPVGPSTSGRIEVIESPNAARTVLLRATGYGATVTVDLRVT